METSSCLSACGRTFAIQSHRIGVRPVSSNILGKRSCVKHSLLDWNLVVSTLTSFPEFQNKELKANNFLE
jgi:hypothetical protein